jgi:selenocysteine lyase/cysteine desulfurase
MLALATGIVGVSTPSVAALRIEDVAVPDATLPAAKLARNEKFWREVATHYDSAKGLINLEHGFWGKMAKPVQSAYLEATMMVNRESSIYGRKGYAEDFQSSVQRVAVALGVSQDEIALTRNATEAVHNLIRQYRHLRSGDAVLYADIDYPQFKTTMRWLGQARGARVVEITLPPRVSAEDLIDAYTQAFDANPDLKLMLLTHASNQHGLILPVAAIAAQARQRGIDVICDCAQSWGLLDFRIEDLGVDWAGFNLHKWIGSPVGVGALYMRRGSLQKIAPYPGETDDGTPRVSNRVHMGTANFASMISVPAALDFHEALGPANKEARLRYLRSVWTEPAQAMPHIEVLGGADEASWSGIGAFRLRGRATAEDAKDLQRRLEEESGLFTVVRGGLASGYCVRITPQVFTTPDEIGQLVDALESLRA